VDLSSELLAARVRSRGDLRAHSAFHHCGRARHSAKVEAQLKVATDQLKSLSTAKNEQKVETVKRIEAVKERVRHADDRAKVIEQAPLPGQCKTPKEVLNADI
jgi:hypothetical protein